MKLPCAVAIVSIATSAAASDKFTAQCANNNNGMLFDFGVADPSDVAMWGCRWEEGNTEIGLQHLGCTGTVLMLQSRPNLERHTLDLYAGETVVAQFLHGHIPGPGDTYMECIWRGKGEREDQAQLR
jgi:hypothetical protein